MLANRRAKYRNRRRLLLKHSDTRQTRATDPRPALEARQQLREVSAALNETELRILVDLANGFTFAEIAVDMEIPIGTVKTWARRARLRLPD